MSAPQTINAYLAALNAALEVGLRNRRRILAEVEDHLCQAEDEQLRRGRSSCEAQRRAVVAFGCAEQVAARFDAGPIGALDRRLALSVRWVHRWLTQHWSGIPAFIVVVSLLFAGALAALGAAFGRDPQVAAGVLLSGAAAVLTFFMLSRSYRQSLRDITKNGTTCYCVRWSFVFPTVGGCLALLRDEYSATVQWAVAIPLVWTLAAGSAWLIEGAITRAARRYLAATEQDRREAWSADHPWQSAVAGATPVPLGLVALITVHPGAVTLRVALVALVAAMAALVVAAVRLEAARRERDAYQHMFMSELT